MNISDLALEVQKVSEKYSNKFKIDRDDDWYVLKLQEELGELIQAYLMVKGKARDKGKTEEELKEGFEKEVADVICHVLLLSKHFQIDIEKVIEKKWLKWNK